MSIYPIFQYLMNKATKKILLSYVLTPILLLVFLWLIYLQIQKTGSLTQEWVAFKNNRHSYNLFLIIIAGLLAPLNWAVEALKWQLLLKKIETITFKKAFISVLSGIAFGFVTPNKTGDFIGKVWHLKKNSRIKGSIAALISSLAQMVVTSAFGFLGMIYLQIYHPTSWTLWVLIASFICLCGLGFGFVNIKWLSKLARRFKRLRLLVVSLYLFKRYSRKELLHILWLALLRFCIYNGQFLVLLYAFQIKLPIVEGFLISGLMFWLITVTPSFFVADIGIRGFITTLVFVNTGIVFNAFPVLTASYAIWLINWVLPALIGSFTSAFSGGKFQRLKNNRESSKPA